MGEPGKKPGLGCCHHHTCVCCVGRGEGVAPMRGVVQQRGHGSTSDTLGASLAQGLPVGATGHSHCRTFSEDRLGLFLPPQATHEPLPSWSVAEPSHFIPTRTGKTTGSWAYVVNCQDL